MPEKGGQVAVELFRRLFDAHPSQVALLDLSGCVVAVNESWHRFGRENGLRSGYRIIGVDYVDVCSRAVHQGAPYAQEALTGVVALLSGAQRSFTLRYPCHSPHEQRWFKLYSELQTPESPSIIIAHTYLGPHRPRGAADPIGFPTGTNWDLPFPQAWHN